MKKLFLFFIVLGIISCSQKDLYKTEKKVTISGRVVNVDTQKRNIDLHIYGICQVPEILSTDLDSTGNFNFHFKSYVPLETELKYGITLTVLTHPGDSIYVEFDGNQSNLVELLKETKFNGSSSKLNNDISAFKGMLYSNFVDLRKVDLQTATIQFDIADFELYLDTMQQEYDNLLEDFNMKISPCNEAKEWGKFLLKQNIYEAIINYAFMHQFEDKSKPAYFNIHVSFYDRLLDLTPIQYSTFLNSRYLPSFIDKYWHFYAFFNLLADESYKQNNTEPGFISSVRLNDSIVFAGLSQYTPDRLLRQLVFTEKMRRDLDALKIESYERNQEILDQIITEPFLKKPLIELYHFTKEKLDNPKIASDAILKILEDSSAKQMMDSILFTNKGKVIYIDCWSDNCGPCLAELPNSKELEEEMRDKDVVFVYVCLNSKEDVWKAIVAKHQLNGQHYFLSKNQSKEWVKAFNITGVPYYFLIDKNQAIVENGSYLRPNIAKPKIEKLLEQ